APPHRARGYVIDERSFGRAQAIVVALAVECDLVPVRQPVGVAEVTAAVLLVLSRAYAVVVTGVVKLLHLGVGQSSAVCVLDSISQGMDVGTGGLERADECSRCADDFAITIG